MSLTCRQKHTYYSAIQLLHAREHVLGETRWLQGISTVARPCTLLSCSECLTLSWVMRDCAVVASPFL
jgi:hypothetical protein